MTKILRLRAIAGFTTRIVTPGPRGRLIHAHQSGASNATYHDTAYSRDRSRGIALQSGTRNTTYHDTASTRDGPRSIEVRSRAPHGLGCWCRMVPPSQPLSANQS
jgi:hypothetical protein